MEVKRDHRERFNRSFVPYIFFLPTHGERFFLVLSESFNEDPMLHFSLEDQDVTLPSKVSTKITKTM
jgi:hypothetical protein